MNKISTISGEYTVLQRKADYLVPLPQRDWGRIKNGINKLSDSTNWWEISLSLLSGIAITSWFSVATIDKTNSNYINFLIVACVATSMALVVLIAMLSIKSRTATTKQSLVNDVAYIEENFANEQTELVANTVDTSDEINSKTFSETKNQQGLNFIPLNIKSGLLTKMSFTINTDSAYWRSGFKLMKPIASSEIATLGHDSALFHLTRTNEKMGLDIYPNGTVESHFKKSIDTDPNKPINLTIERNENNFVSVYINDVVEYNDRFDSELFKRAAFLTWGDGHKYNINLNRLEYSYT